MDIKTISRGGEILKRVPYSGDYWAMVYLVVFFLQAKNCATLKNTANETKLILHRIEQIYSVINDTVKIY